MADKQYYDLLDKDKQDQIKDFLTKHKNTDKDPDYTKKFLELMLKYFVVFTPDGNYRRLSSHTRANEHKEIRKYLEKTKAKDTLEVGFAYGSSALVFAEHHQRMKHTGISHTIIDPNQYATGSGDWEGIGAENLRRCGFVKNRDWRLVEKSSVQALPELLKKYGKNWLDVALIDGWHLFDYTLLDVFYCLEMLKVGGYLIVDDKNQKSVDAVAKYIVRSYSHVLDVCPSCVSSLIIKKKGDDNRSWNADNAVNFNLS